TLSMQIQKLEKSLSVQIFDRTKQPVVPTQLGERIIQQARHVLAESHKIREIIQESKDEMEGELKVGVIPTIAPYLLPAVLGTFFKKYPKIRINIWEYTTYKILDAIRKGSLDCGIMATPTQDDHMLEQPLYYENFVAYLSEDSSLLPKKTVVANDVLSEQLWLLTEGHCMRNQILNICQRK